MLRLRRSPPSHPARHSGPLQLVWGKAGRARQLVEQRIAIAQETRDALTCSFCAARKGALSPDAFDGEHEHGGGLPERATDPIHRITTDQIRSARSYVDDNAADVLGKEA